MFSFGCPNCRGQFSSFCLAVLLFTFLKNTRKILKSPSQMFGLQHGTTSITIANNLNEKLKTSREDICSLHINMSFSYSDSSLSLLMLENANEFSGKRNIPVESSSSPIRSDFNLFRSSLFSRPNASRLSFDESDLDDVSLSLINSRTKSEPLK